MEERKLDEAYEAKHPRGEAAPTDGPGPDVEGGVAVMGPCEEDDVEMEVRTPPPQYLAPPHASLLLLLLLIQR